MCKGVREGNRKWKKENGTLHLTRNPNVYKGVREGNRKWNDGTLHLTRNPNVYKGVREGNRKWKKENGNLES